MPGRPDISRVLATLAMVAAAATTGCGGSPSSSRSTVSEAPATSSPAHPSAPVTIALRVSSSAIPQHGRIPARYTCDGADVSPPLSWTRPPSNTAQLALTVLDANARFFAHWLVLLPPGTRSLATGSPPAGAISGRNGFGRIGYGGPCPPHGAAAHSYEFTVLALRHTLALPRGFPASALSVKPSDVTAAGSLTATYSR